jgi:hypothetical protein
LNDVHISIGLKISSDYLIQIGIGNISEFYEIDRITLSNYPQVNTLLSRYYGGSLYNALQAVYPEFEWHPWKFARKENGIWDDPQLSRRFFDWLAEQLKIESFEQWLNCIVMCMTLF